MRMACVARLTLGTCHHLCQSIQCNCDARASQLFYGLPALCASVDKTNNGSCYTLLMAARRFIYLVLTILALQLSWSAVAAYCEHESGRAAQHFGHHSSEADVHKVAFDGKDQPSGSAKKATMHSHCSSCAHTSLSFSALPVAMAILEPVRLAPGVVSLYYSSSYSARPERPQWISAV